MPVSKNKFQIPVVPPMSNRCIRFPDSIIKEVEKCIQGKECTFTAFVVEAVRMALKDLKEN